MAIVDGHWKYILIAVLPLVLGIATVFIAQAKGPRQFIDPEISSDCHHIVSTAKWSHPEIPDTISHTFRVDIGGGFGNAGFLVDEIGGVGKNRGTSEKMLHRQLKAGQDWQISVLLTRANGEGYFSTGSPILTTGPCPGH